MAARFKLPEPYFFKLLRAQGEIAWTLEVIRKLEGHGVKWDVITAVTGYKRADLRYALSMTMIRKLAKSY